MIICTKHFLFKNRKADAAIIKTELSRQEIAFLQTSEFDTELIFYIFQSCVNFVAVYETHFQAV